VTGARGKGAVDAFTDSLRLFAIGYSWGGYESLVIQCDVRRSAALWEVGHGRGATLRLHIGLENVDDLIRDLENG
jgi:cystathionine beta-lyase